MSPMPPSPPPGPGIPDAEMPPAPDGIEPGLGTQEPAAPPGENKIDKIKNRFMGAMSREDSDNDSELDSADEYTSDD